MNKHSSIKKKA